MKVMNYKLLILLWLLFSLVSAGCEPVEISRGRPWWEEARFDSEGGGMSGGGGAQSAGRAADVENADELKRGVAAVVENADGTLTLNTPIPAYLVSHLYDGLLEERYDLIFTQLVSEMAKAKYADEGRDAWEIAEWLAANRREVIKVLMRMRGGFNSPDLTWSQRGKVYRMQLTGRTAQGMRFTMMDVVREGGQFRLLLIK